MVHMAAGEEADAPGHADERLGDAIMLAVLLLAFCAYWLLSRKPQRLWARQEESGRERQGDNASGANEVYVRAAAHVAQDYWDRYDKAQGWTSSIAPSSKTTSGFEGGKSFKGANRPLDVRWPSPSSRLGACVFKCTCLRTDVAGDSGGRSFCRAAHMSRSDAVGKAAA
jgi:hypothetical protein